MLKRGFTLIEVMVSVMIFSIIMTVALGALLSMSESDRRAEALKSVINNLNFAMESMTRNIRTGYNYHCGTNGTNLVLPAPRDCDAPNGAQSYLAIHAADGSRAAYCLDSGLIKRQVIPSTDQTTALSTNCGDSNKFFPLTSGEVTVSTLQFIVTGSCFQSGGDTSDCTAGSANKQPKVTILINGTVKISATETAPLNLETSATQRIYDQ